MRTETEIKTEIAALKALKPVGPLKRSTARAIAIALEELENGFDRTAAEWDELSDREQNEADCAFDWKQGNVEGKPSTGFGGLVE